MGTHLRVLSESCPIEFQHDRVSMVFKNLCVLRFLVHVFWTKVASALEELKRWSLMKGLGVGVRL